MPSFPRPPHLAFTLDSEKAEDFFQSIDKTAFQQIMPRVAIHKAAKEKPAETSNKSK